SLRPVPKPPSPDAVDPGKLPLAGGPFRQRLAEVRKTQVRSNTGVIAVDPENVAHSAILGTPLALPWAARAETPGPHWPWERWYSGSGVDLHFRITSSGRSIS